MEAVAIKPIKENLYPTSDICPLCEGTGKIEDMMYDCNDETGFNSVAFGTGVFNPCPECQ